MSDFSLVYEKWLFARRYEYCVWVLQQFVIALSACFKDFLELARVVTDQILIHVCQSRVLYGRDGSPGLISITTGLVVPDLFPGRTVRNTITI